MKKIILHSLMISFVLIITLGLPINYISYANAAEELYVNDDWPDSEDTDGDNYFRHIQIAIDNAINGDVIVVNDGTYVENINYKGKAITIRSTDPDNQDVVAYTIINGNQTGSVVTFKNGEGNDSILNGFTVTNGDAFPYGGGICCDNSSSPYILNCIISTNFASYGGGIFCWHSSSPYINNCILSENAAQFGSGIYSCISSPCIVKCIIKDGKKGSGIYCPDSSVNIIDSTITGNSESLTDGGGINCSNSSLNITNCEILKNSAIYGGGGINCSNSVVSVSNSSIRENSVIHSGGGIRCGDSTLTIKNSDISYNLVNSTTFAYGGGISYGHSILTIDNSIINNNSCSGTIDSYGGGFYCVGEADNSLLTITNCIISGNSANGINSRGGGFFCQNSSPIIINNTICGNTADSYGGGFYCIGDSYPVIINTIFWYDTPDEIYITSGNPIVTYSNIQGGFGDPLLTHNINEIPLFKDIADGDYHLNPGSPCIDAGTSGSNIPLEDIEGNPRDEKPDMGAYENTVKEIRVFIDIKPGSEPNCFNNDGHGVIPVAIMGAVNFNVSDIDSETISLEGLNVKVVGKSNKLLAHYEDINNDGFEDLIVQIEDIDNMFSEGDITATITGNLYDGTSIEGSDYICIVP